jgi:hypothetical protein
LPISAANTSPKRVAPRIARFRACTRSPLSMDGAIRKGRWSRHRSRERVNWCRLNRSRQAVLSLLLSFSILSAFAKRLPPKPVPAVVNAGIQYSAAGDGRTQYVVATDLNTSRELWRVMIFRNSINAQLEEDVQSVFITNLKLVGDSLLVKDEKNRCYRLEVASRHVKREHCSSF